MRTRRRVIRARWQQAMADRYATYAELRRREAEGFDFRIVLRDAKRNTVIVAPHGGSIEPGTSEIADAIAGDTFSFYALEGLKPRGNHSLHITSWRFDEPRCVALVGVANRVLTIHGEDSERDVVFLGGRDAETAERLRVSLARRGFTVLSHEDPKLRGLDVTNICNRGSSGSGVQIEVAAGLRRAMFRSLVAAGRAFKTKRFWQFVAAVRAGLDESDGA